MSINYLGMISAISFTNAKIVEGKKDKILVLETNLRDLMLLSFSIKKKMSIEHLVNLGDFAKNFAKNITKTMLPRCFIKITVHPSFT